MSGQDKRCCYDCGVAPGQLHIPGCVVERCPYCGRQLLSCFCPGIGLDHVPDDDRLAWAGEWPGLAECVEFGWFAKRVPGRRGWVPCSPDDPDASPDLNRLLLEAAWDRDRKRFVRSG
jgi:hypothetical protein